MTDQLAAVPAFSLPADPLDSPLWETVAEKYLPGHPIVFTDKVQVGLPPVTEDQTQVPITIDARALGPVERVVVIADLSPFPLTLTVRPRETPPVFAFRVRIEQGTAIRAAALQDGRWHVGARYLDAAGGGCMAPPNVEARLNWDDIGRMRARLWREDGDRLRLRLRVTHPMDTGLHKEPPFFIQAIDIKDAGGATLADMEVHEPIAADPAFMLQFADPGRGDHVVVTARDNDGGVYASKVPLPPAGAPIREGRL